MHCKQMRAKKGNEPQSVKVVPHSALSARLRWTRLLLQCLQRPLGYTECPHFNPHSPVAGHNASTVTSQQRTGFHPTFHMHCKQMRAKKGNGPPKGRTCPSRCSECPSPMDPIPLAVAAVHRMPSPSPVAGTAECPHFNPDSPVAEHNASTCHQEKAMTPKGSTCPSRCSECPSPMDPIPLAVAAARSSAESAAQRFSPYLPHALQANESKKRQ